jgi:hypothetical protein
MIMPDEELPVYRQLYKEAMALAMDWKAMYHELKNRQSLGSRFEMPPNELREVLESASDRGLKVNKLEDFLHSGPAYKRSDEVK